MSAEAAHRKAIADLTRHVVQLRSDVASLRRALTLIAVGCLLWGALVTFAIRDGVEPTETVETTPESIEGRTVLIERDR